VSIAITATDTVATIAAKINTAGAGVLATEASHHWFPGDDLFAIQRPRGLPSVSGAAA
jgi:hypothetical protein